MPRTLSATARAKKTEALRQEFPYLESQLDAFRDNGLNADEALAIINDRKAGTSMPGKVAMKFSALEDDQKERVQNAAEAICDGYAEFFEKRRESGVELTAKDALEGLQGDLYKICNFNHATPYHKARQGIEGYLRQQDLGLDVDVDVPHQEIGGEDKNKENEEAEKPKHSIFDKTEARKLGVTAGAIAGVAAAAEASKSWRERVKKPEAKKRALAFASVAAVSAVGIAASLFLGRSNGGGMSR
jgi:hypothetical protein